MLTQTAAAHTAEIIPGPEGFTVQCPHGCNLGTSATQADRTGAEARVQTHRLATRPLGRNYQDRD